jgi:hypothetical protein
MPKLKGLVFGEFDRHGEVADATWHRKHKKPLTSRAKCVMRPGQGQEL